jgi:hypothetical protein
MPKKRKAKELHLIIGPPGPQGVSGRDGRDLSHELAALEKRVTALERTVWKGVAG